MGNKFRKRPRFQLFNVPNDLKHQAQRAGEEWADNMGYCSQCRELRRPMVVTAGKDPKDNKRFIYMLCAGCVQKLDQMKAGVKPEEFLKDALGNLLQGKAQMDKEKENSPLQQAILDSQTEEAAKAVKSIENTLRIETGEQP